MNKPFKHQAIALAIGALVAITTPVAQAQTSGGTLEQSASTIDQTASTSPNRAASGIAKEFTPLVGSEADAQKLVDGLRNGTPMTVGGATIAPKGPTGYGNVFITLALAQSSLAAAGITSPTAEQLNAALTGGTVTTADGKVVNLSGVMTLRASGMGWGQIAKQLDLKLGRVISSIKSGNERLAKTLKEDRTEKKSSGQERSQQARAENAEKAEKADRAEKVQRTEKVERVEKVERPEKVDRPERPERPEKVERPERPEKIERSGR